MVRKERLVPIRALKRAIETSSMSLWRDLKALEESGLIKRMHGAIALPDYSIHGGSEPVFQHKAAQSAPQKAAIARHVARELILPGEILCLTSGSTVAAVVPFLDPGQLTLLTNSLEVMNAAAPISQRLTLLTSGGMYRELSHTFVGPQAEAFFQEHTADTLLLGAAGLTLKEGVTDPNPLDTVIKKAMIASARRVIAVMNSTKLGTRSMTAVMALEDLDILVTDGNAPDEMLHEIERLGVDVRVVED